MTPTEQVNKRMHDLATENLSERQFFESKFRAYKAFLEAQGKLEGLGKDLATVSEALKLIMDEQKQNKQPKKH
jgi:hypothetical protein